MDVSLELFCAQFIFQSFSNVDTYIYVYIYIYICVCVCVYIYIYIYKLAL